MGSEGHRAIELTVARAAVSVVRDRQQVLPLDPGAPITLVNSTRRSAYAVLTQTRGIGPNQATPAFDVFAAAMQAACDQLTIISAEEFTLSALPEAGAIIAVTENYTLPGLDFDQGLQVQIVRDVQAAARDRLIVLALRDPYELADLPDVDGYVCAFSFRPSAAEAAADVLLGQVEAGGRSPVSVPGTEIGAG